MAFLQAAAGAGRRGRRRLAGAGRVLDLGCGLGTELAHLAGLGFTAVGVDLSTVALRRARRLHPRVGFLGGRHAAAAVPRRVLRGGPGPGQLPLPAAAHRARYAAEVRRVLRPGGRLLLRACLYAHGIRNDLTPQVLAEAFAGWRAVDLSEAQIPSDTRQMTALVARYERPAT